MICPKCKGEFVVEDGKYKCIACQISLPVVFHGYELKQDDVDKLVLEGITDEIEFFSQAKNKRFRARLVYENGRVAFEFRSGKGNKWNMGDERGKENDTICIFLNSLSSGVVRVFKIDRDRKEEKIYDFGTKATRYSHALSLIAILPLIPVEKKLRIISDDIAFVKYVLGEATPSDREIRTGIYVLLQLLKNYTWSLELSIKKLKLKGGNSKKLSKNLFPYISVTKTEEQGNIIVEIENCNLAVEEHFLEYMQKARKLKLGKYIISKELAGKLEIWQQAAKS
ncbi:topoisomerase C-terminal repeat-containing protein [Caldicellulosiruptor morganii]|uniref:TFIIB-type zinc ribbon-containing protein n=1 Tax=Caldicellulosiruptor morganii TaxID=1387555 RepID=A0ABY7BL35_9FIRM|nr:topoisomerase C-terminal repeat-containing protein [Caldicellulosiruptor morganii]WAM33299.1 TFIIB-type zinc ribbon-containing protein [Caldicellulosiruptor morganii]